MPEALEAGLEVYQGKALVNSVTGEDERLEAVLPVVAKYGAAVVAICHDDDGISNDPDVRIAAARKIISRAADHGIPAADVVIDPVVMPVGAVHDSGTSVFEVLRRAREELGVNTTCGASNVSFGLPERRMLNGAFLSMMVGFGLTSAIVNPLHEEVVAAIMGAEVLAGRDRMCKALDQTVPAQTGRGIGPPEQGRRNRAAGTGPRNRAAGTGPPEQGPPEQGGSGC